MLQVACLFSAHPCSPRQRPQRRSAVLSSAQVHKLATSEGLGRTKAARCWERRMFLAFGCELWYAPSRSPHGEGTATLTTRIRTELELSRRADDVTVSYCSNAPP